MLELQKSIKKIIERFIVNKTPVTDSLSKGDTIIPLESSRRYECGDLIAIYYKPSMDVQAEAEVHTIVNIPDQNHIEISDGLIENYPQSDTFVQKMVGGTFLEAVYLGDPEVIPRYPAITIDAKSKTNSWLTLESISEEYAIDISVYVESEFYETQYELMHRYAKAIESSLFRSFYPLVEPYDSTTLVETVNQGDTVIRITDEDMLLCGSATWIFFESYDYLRSNRVTQSLGNGVYELLLPMNRTFEAGDLVIRPRRHIYNTLPANIQYGTVNKNTTLKAARLSYIANEEKRIFVPFRDSLVL